jgi:hypothetical protein
MRIILRSGKYFGQPSHILKFIEPLQAKIPELKIEVFQWQQAITYGYEPTSIFAHSFAVFSTLAELYNLESEPT